MEDIRMTGRVIGRVIGRGSVCLAIGVAMLGLGAPRMADAAPAPAPAPAAAPMADNGLQTATDLLNLCGNRIDAAQIACKFYIHGALQAAEMMHAADRGGQFVALFCPNENLSTDDFVAALRKQMTTHPERRTFPAATVIVGGAIEAYPCPKISAAAAASKGVTPRRPRRRHRTHHPAPAPKP